MEGGGAVEEYRSLIVHMLYEMNEADLVFVKQIFTFIKKHMKKAGRR